MASAQRTRCWRRPVPFRFACSFGISSVLLRHLLGKQGNALHILHGLRRKTQHEVQLYTVPAALETPRAEPFKISSSVRPLLITLRRRWEPASGAKVRLLFFTSCTLLITSRENASIRRDGRDTLTPFPSKLIDQEIDESLQLRVITGA